MSVLRGNGSRRHVERDTPAARPVEALLHALAANVTNGLRRTNADKRRCVEIALKEFPKLSSRAVAELCGVGKDMVEGLRPAQVAENATSRTGTDGKQYPAKTHPLCGYGTQD